MYVKNLQQEYKETSKSKIRVFGRERYPTRTFSTTPLKTVKYLPTTTYYSVVDSQTEQVIIPFDTNYTKVSCDSSGNYFNLDLLIVMKKRVAILKGGDSVEREVSLSTGQSCSKALIRLGYNVKSIDTKENFIDELIKFKPDVVFNA